MQVVVAAYGGELALPNNEIGEDGLAEPAKLESPRQRRPWHAPQLLLTEINLTEIVVSSTVVDDGPASFYS
jgi:hypothetical protein